MTMTFDRIEYFLLDPSGVERGKWAPGKSIDAVHREAITFPLSLTGLDIWGREVPETGLHIETGDRDGVCSVVPGSVAPMPWLDGNPAEAMLEMRQADGSPFYANSRNCVADAVAGLAELGLSATVAAELEFHLTDPKAERPAEPVERQDMYDLRALAAARPVLDEIRQSAEIQNVPADTVISEASADQFEVNLKHRNDALAAADDAVRLRRIIRGAAAKFGLEATFMAKPFADRPGNGLHLHVSLVDQEGRNLFGETPDGTQKLAHAAGGLLETMGDGMLVFANTWNGFRRFEPGSYAPNRLNWGEDNRSVAVRIPRSGPEARRFEHRIAGADANPYLVMALVLQGARRGVIQAIDPPPPSNGNAYEGEAPMLGRDMGAAIDRFSGSPFIREALGSELQAHLVAVKRQECAVFEGHISRFELDTYR
ncbi:MAG: glutamine synthetase family protein [Pseudomonadota bacterium]